MTVKWQGPGKMQFSKWQGLGNNYIVLHREEIPFELTPERVRLLCDRDFGIGCDGILVVGPKTGDDRFALQIFNPDGSEAEMCGNGVRMVARKLKMEGSIAGDTVVLETAAGEIMPTLLGGGSWSRRHGHRPVRRREARRLRRRSRRTPPCTRRGATSPSPSSTWATRTPSSSRRGRSSSCPLHEVGPMIEEHKYFPRKANVEFVKVCGEHEAKVRVWERGVGETRACGTGATATAVALVRTGQCESPVTVELPGGRLEVEVLHDWRVFMTGPAEEIYHGDLSLEFLRHLE